MRGKRENGIVTVCVILFWVFVGMAVWIENADWQEYDVGVFGDRVCNLIQTELIGEVLPVLGYADKEMWQVKLESDADFFIKEMPVYDYALENVRLASGTGDYETYADFINQQNAIQDINEQEFECQPETSAYYEEMVNENHHAVLFTRETDFFTGGSGFISEISAFWITEFVKATDKSVQYDKSQLTDYKFVMENFYTVDASTAAGPDVITPETFLSYDTTIDKDAPGPHILIYHTHSQEAFADSIPGDKSTTIVGAGAKLAELLREEYGYEVYHHTGEYDVNGRDDAYAKSAPAIEAILEEYPQIQVVIDLHRDGVAENRHLVTNWEGRDVAQFMFFNGLSYLNTKGEISYLPNPNLQGNLALSYCATITANEYYPGLARRTYLNGYRYNMHYREKTMLIELGAQTNTVDEIMSACEPLAHILDMVFSGEKLE